MVEKLYPKSTGVILSTISDIIELQKAKLTFSNTSKGIVNFQIQMYAYTWDVSFVVTRHDDKQSRVKLDIAGEHLGRDDMVLRELSLLDSMLSVAG